ncbi:MAG: hypothetical protein HY308_04355 [Gammaproteobacteria bacterium]|nr:hypothetical protein [Gammaproteobacteria bacterium]
MERVATDLQLVLRCELSVAKDSRYRNEDSFQSSDRRGVYALSDGASISYDSASWSQILTRRFARFPIIDQEWLSQAIADFDKLHNRDAMDWIQQSAFDRGSFASLLGVRYDKHTENLLITAIGDSIAVLCDGDEIKATFPYHAPEQFDLDPYLLSTNSAKNSFFEEGHLKFEHVVELSLTDFSKPTVFCMIDALGRWFFEHRNAGLSPVATLRDVAQKTQKQFLNFVEAERAAKRMKYDDTTLLALW